MIEKFITSNREAGFVFSKIEGEKGDFFIHEVPEERDMKPVSIPVLVKGVIEGNRNGKSYGIIKAKDTFESQDAMWGPRFYKAGTYHMRIKEPTVHYCIYSVKDNKVIVQKNFVILKPGESIRQFMGSHVAVIGGCTYNDREYVKTRVFPVSGIGSDILNSTEKPIIVVAFSVEDEDKVEVETDFPEELII